MSALAFRVLGPLEVRRDDQLLALGGPKQRAVLAVLLLEAGRVVPATSLVEHVWGPDGAEGASASLQVYVSTLRKLLRADDSEATDDRLSFVRPGYRLRVEPGELDLAAADDALAQARERRAAGDLPAAAHLLRYGLSLWRGRVCADLVEIPGIAPLLVGVERRHEVLAHECYDVELELGRHLSLVPELEAAVAAAPLDERLAGQHMVALYRSGRQAEALAAYRRTADRLREELGIEAGAALRALHEAILRQDLALDPVPEAAVAATMTHDDRGVRGATLTLPNGVSLELGSRTWVVGRHPDCDVVLSDPEVSRRHVELRPVVGGYDLVDLGSSNGTRVGEQDVDRHRLVDGDVVRVGSTELAFHQP